MVMNDSSRRRERTKKVVEIKLNVNPLRSERKINLIIVRLIFSPLFADIFGFKRNVMLSPALRLDSRRYS